MTTALPVLLPGRSTLKEPTTSHLEWTPQRYRIAPQPPPQDNGKVQEIELANARQILDGKLIKKMRPRRTIDYNGELGRWALLHKLRPNPHYVPYLRPALPYIVDVRQLLCVCMFVWLKIPASAATPEGMRIQKTLQRTHLYE
ncbi:hypothetical protein DXG03_006304 [Asterophora parasitica]|uniref:Uncharacterized protein n=1 Tax=Asterophora parasitica TaxID=117018 RepID=A0A9P7K9E0_9AGAR|nr:hypothetical protein DXG03_006304 [Asterophora parasitica]